MILLGKPKKFAGPRLRRKWLSHVPAMMGMKMKVEGIPYQGTCLYVANHIGYIDPFIIMVEVETNVVAKAEILKWPLVGLGGYLAGTIFVKREKKSSRHETLLAIRAALEDGTSILVFPEGTTSAGPGTLPFRPRSFEAASLANVPVQPIAIIYDSPLVAFVDNHTFIPHFFRLFRLKYISGRVVFGPLLRGDHTSDASQQWIEHILSEKIYQAA
ncbi:MAG TPA: lysophospholipid acyltransferase family protein [Saprospiraceae bacterium]|nr:lysophospholipid acyltransferase family protein [Saprospiraceae bacterium]